MFFFKIVVLRPSAAKVQQDSASAQTILGEIQASLYFAETQAIHNGIVKGIRESSEDMISQIYIALHKKSKRGQSGPGSVAVKAFATEIASEHIDSALVVGEDGKKSNY
jgi:hypothetical protein